MYNKELVRKALLGDREAQRECTEKGIVLPCPICGGEIKIKQCDWDMFYPYCNGCKFTFNFLFDSKKDAIEVVNARPAPPVGRCEDCKWYVVKKPKCCGYCKLIQTTFGCEEFCSYFDPREE